MFLIESHTLFCLLLLKVAQEVKLSSLHFTELMCSLFSADFPPFFLMGIRIRPSDTVQELNALVDVYNELVDAFGTTSGVILGDMSAECRYLSKKEYEALDLVNDPRFTWLIDSTMDTTTSAADCSYDR